MKAKFQHLNTGNFLHCERIKRNLSRGAMADLLRLSDGQYRRIETNEVQITQQIFERCLDILDYEMLITPKNQ